jgi:outer membrane protein assembly factor BamA
MKSNKQTTETMEAAQEAPSKEKVMEWMLDQIAFKKVQLELQEVDTKIAVSRSEYMKAMYTIAQISSPQDSPTLKQHTLTEEDISANPELIEQGFKVGDVVGIPPHTEEEEIEFTPESTTNSPLQPTRGLKK